MTDADVIAKVRAAAVRHGSRHDTLNSPPSTEVVCARAAMALVEQYEDCLRHGCDHGARTMSALRTAVGE